MKKVKVAKRTRSGMKGKAQKTSTTLNSSTVKTLSIFTKPLSCQKYPKTMRVLAKPEGNMLVT